VRRVLDDPSFAAGAQRLANAIAAETAEDRAAAELEALAEQSMGAGSAPVPSAL
jgi:UDP:flavonoid glycosyltransferase YjiC (YdhE family)